ncbi:MAG: hypothetical protein FWE47_01735 [Oscillospiraceae bacterium]|nr:hypothetical protein [Oscillospiraceae bacterium]
MNNNINEQGLKNIYWKAFEKSGKINDYLAFANQKEAPSGKNVSENPGFSGAVDPAGRLQ